ncbi:MAG: DUF1015 domain-containing protein [Desulfatitalea sp.]|nr:DUF1015 domain-containing protein [Desulfatitalea sp.]MBI5895901.1 DUF1015 domain-containing protein [Desulfobacterales bacterium]
MAEVVPFNGIRYNPDVITDMAAVVAPPYDVISPKEQDGFHERHPNNVIRIELGKNQPGDDAQDNVHSRAGRYFQTWISEKILVPETKPAIYLTTVEFSSGGKRYTRFGIIGRVHLEPFEKGIILPHERTFSKVKSERLMLMKECHANFSPIFGLFADGKEILQRMSQITVSQTPDVALVDDKGHQQKMWCLTDKKVTDELTAFFAHERIYIADGHHRYETALNYRDWVKENTPGFSSDHPANFIMMSLSSMVDTGMIILPAHRLLKALSQESISALLRRSPECFDLFPISLDQGLSSAMVEFNKVMAAKAHTNAIGLYLKKPPLLQVLVLKEGVMARFFQDLDAVLRDLDVNVLTQLIMMELMGFDQARLDDETKIAYRTTSMEAVEAVNAGEAEVAFILNPTKIEQVQRVAEKGLIMPRKSTYFYPKVISGLVFNRLGA